MIAREGWFPSIDRELSDRLAAEGLTLVGVCDAVASPEEEEQFRRWIDAGHHGSMTYLERHAELKYRPAALMPDCASLIFVGLNYYQRPAAPPGRSAGRVARYAWGRDYHKELGNRLRRVARSLAERYPEDRFRSWTDATPLAERYYAERAGIAFTGRNTLLIHGSLGSWFVVGEILSTRRFSPSESAEGRHGACPGNCRRCIDVCPTRALFAPYRIDASRCISYLTIEYDGVIPEALRPLMGEWIFGCDLCQEVCPLNVRAQVTEVAGFVKPIAGSDVDLAEILAIPNDAAYTRRFAGSPLMRAKRRRLVRNACIAAANLRATHLLTRIEGLTTDGDEIIAVHARWAAGRLRDTP